MTSQSRSTTEQQQQQQQPPPPPPPHSEQSRPPSIAPSETSTQYLQEQQQEQDDDNNNNRTPRATSLASTRAPSLTSTLVADDSHRQRQQRYKGFPSEEAYLAALREWVESKKYIQTDATMVGYYGTTTMDEYASRPKVELGWSRRWKERKVRKDAARRNSAATATAAAAAS
ncbi:Hypothetical predicted protein [Lecanosticta acicola]|uniref:Uncharacterized protein n=1 Tax=Lecanosticta acicola TaxID=111012 RepID=A0AAI8Z2A6_9PEZI|nr:Hypothetical predicted protein [Lecanosticta acicola]